MASGEVERAFRAAADLSRADLPAALREAKRRLALTVALADILGLWSLERVTGALSHAADLALRATVAVLLRDLARRGERTR